MRWRNRVYEDHADMYGQFGRSRQFGVGWTALPLLAFPALFDAVPEREHR
jgi:hypothetical protein